MTTFCSINNLFIECHQFHDFKPWTCQVNVKWSCLKHNFLLLGYGVLSSSLECPHGPFPQWPNFSWIPLSNKYLIHIFLCILRLIYHLQIFNHENAHQTSWNMETLLMGQSLRSHNKVVTFHQSMILVTTSNDITKLLINMERLMLMMNLERFNLCFHYRRTKVFLVFLTTWTRSCKFPRFWNPLEILFYTTS